MADGLRLSAYVLAADPTWLEESVASYYSMVDRIVVSFDASSTGWTGAKIAVEESLERLAALDVDGKMELAPGSYFDPDRDPLASDTHQRRAALRQAGSDSDWVVQLDTDEVLADPDEFVSCLVEADRSGYSGLEYPARVLYQHVRGTRYLEQCRRFWTIAADYPGPVAVKSGAELTLCRQSEVDLFRVDFRSRNTDLAHPDDAPVHRVVDTKQGILHYSWVRSDEHMVAKSRSSGHAADFDWSPVIRRWMSRREHPLRTVLGTPLRRGPDRRFLRLTTIDDGPDRRSRERNGLSS